MNPIPCQRFPREHAAEAASPLLRHGWSDWVKAMVPQAAQQPQFSTQRPNGWRQESKDILSNAPGLYYDVGSGYGINEWQAKKVENWNESKIVVYIGSTSNAHPESSLRVELKNTALMHLTKQSEIL